MGDIAKGVAKHTLARKKKGFSISQQ